MFECTQTQMHAHTKYKHRLCVNKSNVKPLDEIPCHLEIQVPPVHLATRLHPVNRDNKMSLSSL